MTMTNSHVVCTFCAKLCDLDMAFMSRDKQAVRSDEKKMRACFFGLFEEYTGISVYGL